MLTVDELDLRREVLLGARDLVALRDRLLARGRRILEQPLHISPLKGLLSADGGFCPDDGTALVFDPMSPGRHCCPRCGKVVTGERHDGRWAWLYHLWMAERIAEFSLTGLLGQDEALVAWSAGAIRDYGPIYHACPNRDNVLGPSHLFFSTYLESVWLTNYLAGAFLLRDSGALDREGIAAVDGIAEEAATLIGEFDEGLSNRQTWHNAALAAAAVWFEDEQLAQRAVEGPRGLVGHLVDGFRPDGMWYEGENYHLFALRGLLTGAAWSRLAGVDLFEEAASQERLAAALRAPTLSALPDGTYPARKDSRFGVSLAQPMYLELWEHGVSRVLATDHPDAAGELGDWLRHLYALPAPPAETFDSYLHEAGEATPAHRGRSDLSWWMLATMTPELPGAGVPWSPKSVLLPEQGVAILRDGDRYVSLECGEYGGGHGHPDRLHLTLFGGGKHWLADPGTGTYVSPDLFWYRSTLAHNAPRVDGTSQPMTDARAQMFDQNGHWGWVRGRWEGLTRTVVAGPGQLVDVLEFADDHEHSIELTWHPDGDLEIVTAGRWEPVTFTDRFAHHAERFVPAEAGAIAWRARLPGQLLEGIFDATGELLRLTGPGRPGQAGERPFLLRRHSGRYVRLATVLAFDSHSLTGARFTPGEIVVETGIGATVHRQTSEGWEVEDHGERTALKGLRREGLPGIDLPDVGADLFKYVPPEATVRHVPLPPALDGTLAGFVADDPVSLDHEDQYRRTEEPYGGSEAFSAQAWLGWDEAALYLAVKVTKDDLCFRPADSAPLRLDNESDLIHSDGLQLYLQVDRQPRLGWLIVPDPAGSALQIQPIAGTAATAEGIHGAWQADDQGYMITVGISSPGWPPSANDPPPRFDLIVNEMRSERTRRLGQLVWTGGGGWAYLRGDRQDPSRAGRLLLA